MKTITPLCLAALVALLPAVATADAPWQSLFDGRSLDGWRANENPSTFTVADGCIIVKGPRSHLFYEGPVGGHNFINFEFSAEVKTMPKGNSGVFFHTAWQPDGWPAQGHEVQVNNSHKDPKRTAGIYNTLDNLEAVATDGTWFTLRIRVEGKRVTVHVDDKLITDYTEPAELKLPPKQLARRLGRGTIALQGHDPESEIHYRNLRLRVLP
jgi:hypothetical protein